MSSTTRAVAGVAASIAFGSSFILFFSAPAGAAGIANFENFYEGNFFNPSFTDPVSGIFFSNSTAANQDFVMEFGAFSPQRPLTSPGIYMGANGWAPGDGISLPYQFGLDARLPENSGIVQMEMIYAVSGGNTVNVTGLNENNQVVANTSFHTTSGNFVETTLTLTSASNNIRTIHIEAIDIFNAFDNIRFAPIPEPGTAGVLAGALVVGMSRRRRRRVA